MTFYKQYRKVPSLLLKKKKIGYELAKQNKCLKPFSAAVPVLEGELIGLHCFSKDQKKEGEVCLEYSD